MLKQGDEAYRERSQGCPCEGMNSGLEDWVGTLGADQFLREWAVAIELMIFSTCRHSYHVMPSSTRPSLELSKHHDI